MPNHLLTSSSPYLRQHAHNPVDWYPWSPEALDRARREDKPIFLSIGYAACHWCHVMAHQCFENPAIAALMNEHFINIKVDREERPDLDDLYMLATQLMTGQGGWPMSLWLTPALEPFYAGTYFPPTDNHGRPGFPRLLTALHDAWQNRRPDLLVQSQKVVEAIRMHADESAGNAGVSPADEHGAGTASSKDYLHALETRNLKLETTTLLPLALQQFSDRFDDVHGGLGTGGPKFPPHQTLQFFLTLLNTPDWKSTGLAISDHGILAHHVALTLTAMAHGGIYDHVGGAFARYATDEAWLIPHFEKMLYDNAQLAPLYAQASILFGNPDYACIARETLDFFIREMQSPEGAFYSSLDADSEGAEGKYYIWTLADIHAAFPNPDDANLIIQHFQLTPTGNWHESPVPNANILHTTNDFASSNQIENRKSNFENLLLQLRDYRSRRPRPACDDKILTSWNALMLSALAITARTLNEPRYRAAAERLADFLFTKHRADDGSLQRVSHNGVAHIPAFLDDQAYLLNGLLDLAEATDGTRHQTTLARAQSLADTLCRDFQDQKHGGFFFTGPHHELLFARMKNAADNATPSANGIAIRALLRLAHLTANPAYRTAALHAIQAFHIPLARRPEYFPTLLLAMLEHHTSQDDASFSTQAHVDDPMTNGATNGPITLTYDPLPPAIAPGSSFEITVHVTIAPGFHIQSADATGPNIRTTLQLRTSVGQALAASECHFPPTQTLHNTIGLAGAFDIRVLCRLSPDARPGPELLRATLTAQPCTENSCFAPLSVSLGIPLTIRHIL